MEEPTKEELKIANEICDALEEEPIPYKSNFIGGFIAILVGSQILSSFSKGLNNN